MGFVDELIAPAITSRVFGVIVAAAELLLLLFVELFIIAKKAEVPGDGGKATGPPTRGVRPVPGVSPVRGVRPVLGVRPVRKEEGSNWIEDLSFVLLFCGPASIAGERGPARREPRDWL